MKSRASHLKPPHDSLTVDALHVLRGLAVERGGSQSVVAVRALLTGSCANAGAQVYLQRPLTLKHWSAYKAFPRVYTKVKTPPRSADDLVYSIDNQLT